MSIAAAPPLRLDLALRENDDYLLPLRWLRSDRVTPIPIVMARLTMRLDPLEVFDADGVRLPPVDVQIAETTPGAGGWIDTSRYAQGEALVHIVHELWAAHLERTGVYDAIAMSTDGVQECLARGELVVETGVSV